LFEEGIVRNLDNMEKIISSCDTMQDYRGYPIRLSLKHLKNFQLSDEILRMKNVRFDFGNSKPIHKLVSPEPHFVEEEMNLIKNHFKYLGKIWYIDTGFEEWKCIRMDCEGNLVREYSQLIKNLSYLGESYDIECQKCFEMDCEGHLVSIIFDSIPFSKERIEHLSNFPHLRNLDIYSSTTKNQSVTNLSLLSNLANLSINFERVFKDPALLKDLGLFSNLLYLDLFSPTVGLAIMVLKITKFDSFPLSLLYILYFY